jgi:hypothetical protein
MKTGLIVVAILAWFLLTTYRSVRKNLAQQDVDEQPSSNTRPAFETLFDDEEEVTFADNANQSGYFSYETVEEVKPQPSKSKSKDKKYKPIQQAKPTVDPSAISEPIAATEEIESEWQNFDLRKAVIYDTILNNKYFQTGNVA